MRKSFVKILLFVFFYFLLSQTAFGDTLATPCSYEVFSENKTFVFVMLAPDKEIECRSQGEEKKQEAEKLRETFQLSGLYKSEDSQKPLWTIDWYCFQVFISSDGKYLVRKGPWASNATDEAFSFFDNGKLVKTYTVNDLIRYISALPHSVSHFQWEKGSKFDDSKNTFEVSTLEDGNFLFNVENGEIINKSLPILPNKKGLTEPSFYISIFLPLICIFAVISILGFYFYKKLSKRIW